MTCRTISVPLMWGAVLAVSSPGRAQTPSPLDNYRNLKHPPIKENFNKGWQERVLVEFDIINSADLAALRAGLKDRDPFVRSIAARALGIRGDKDSAEALAELVQTDPEGMVRVRAVESLGLLKMKPEVIELAKKDGADAVQWVARMAAGQLKSDMDFGMVHGLKRAICSFNPEPKATEFSMLDRSRAVAFGSGLNDSFPTA